MAESGRGDNGIARKFFTGGPSDVRAEPGEAVRRSSVPFASEAAKAGGSTKHFIASGSIQSRDADRPPVRDRQGVTKPPMAGSRAR
jgi:hypothetical protein